MRALVFVCERTSWVVLVNTWARDRAEAVERDPLFVYPVINIRDMIWTLNGNIWQELFWTTSVQSFIIQ